MKINGQKITRATGTLPKDFTKAVATLYRPYIEITEDEFDRIKEFTSSTDNKEQTDFVIYDNQKCTFGNADDGFALMPTTC